MRAQLLLAAVLAVAVTACKGSAGAKGVDGADGADGAKGDKGDPGAPGKDGAKGATGTSGKDGTNGTNGTDGTNGTNGTDGTNGMDGMNGNDIILSETARTGLALSPVTVDVEGLDGDRIESVGRGAYMVNAVADCQGCHNGTDAQGHTLFLAGNADFPLGGLDSTTVQPCTVGATDCIDSHVFARNLTPDATTGLQLSEDQFIEALRKGTDFKNTATLMVMPWPQLRWLTTQDLRDIYHYLKHIPAVDNAVQADAKPIFTLPGASPFYDTNGDPVPVPQFADGDVTRPLPAAFDPAAGMPTTEAGEPFDTNNVLRGLAISPLADDSLVASMSAGDQALYGRGSYIVNGPGLCNECHTPGGRNKMTNKVDTTTFLSGGQAFAVPPPLQPILHQVRTMSANLTGDNAGFTAGFSVFLDTLLSGASFSTTPPHGLGFPMPFDVFRNMTTADKQAVYTYITTIQQAGLITGDAKRQAPARYCTSATAATDCPGSGETCATITINGMSTGECVGGACSVDSDCDACQTCDGGTSKCIAEDSTSACVMTSL